MVGGGGGVGGGVNGDLVIFLCPRVGDCLAQAWSFDNIN